MARDYASQQVSSIEPPTTKTWTVDELRHAYDTLSDQRLGKALRRVLDWAVEKGCFFSTRAQSPGFGLRGQAGGRIASFFPEWTFCYLDSSVYEGGVQERDDLVSKLKSVGLFEQELKPEAVAMGRNLARKISELSDDELQNLLDIFVAHCGKP